MQTPEIPQKPLEDLAFNFVGPLPNINGYNVILVITCRLSAYCRIISCCQKGLVERAAHRFYTGWLALFSAPQSLIADRDKC